MFPKKSGPNTLSEDLLSLNLFLQKDKNNIDDIPDFISNPSPGLRANVEYFSNKEWIKGYFSNCHRDLVFRDRWLAATGSWNHKVVVDIGCGPGNLFATLGGNPQFLLGIDVSQACLEMAQELGYETLLADAHQLPLMSGFADIVTLNAALHHCDDMKKVLQESARLVKPGGLLIADHDPQLSAWNYRGIALFLYKIRLEVYKFFFPQLHIPKSERLCALATELHHKPGHGVTCDLFRNILEPLDFDVKLYPHNQTVGCEVLEGEMGTPPHWRYRLGQRLSGINPYTPEAALSIMCVAKKRK